MKSFILYLYIIGAAQGVILALALWNKKANALSNRVLGIWLIFLAFDLFMKVVFMNNKDTPFIFFYRIIQFFPFLYGSFFFLYVKTLISKSAITLKDMLHFSGFMVFLGINLPGMFIQDRSYLVGLKYFDVFLYIYSISYVCAGLYLIIKYRKNLQQQQVDTHAIDLKWLYVMGCSQIIIWLIAVFQWLLSSHEGNVWMIYIAVSIWMVLTGYLSLIQQNIPEIKPIKSMAEVNDARFDEIKLRLDQLIERNQIHLQPNLSIGVLAKSSGYPEYLLSLFINRKHGMNFHDFINNLRINEAQNILRQPDDKRTILQVAYDCGYNSKSTFNTAFKKFVKQTPSQFRQTHHSS